MLSSKNAHGITYAPGLIGTSWKRGLCIEGLEYHGGEGYSNEMKLVQEVWEGRGGVTREGIMYSLGLGTSWRGGYAQLNGTSWGRGGIDGRMVHVTRGRELYNGSW